MPSTSTHRCPQLHLWPAHHEPRDLLLHQQAPTQCPSPVRCKKHRCPHLHLCPNAPHPWGCGRGGGGVGHVVGQGEGVHGRGCSVSFHQQAPTQHPSPVRYAPPPTPTTGPPSASASPAAVRQWLVALARHPGLALGSVVTLSLRLDAGSHADNFGVGLVEPDTVDLSAGVSGALGSRGRG